MSTNSRTRVLNNSALTVLAFLLCLSASTSSTQAQQSDRGQREAMKSDVEAVSQESSTKESLSGRILKGRLPRYFSAVVSPEQRSEIYSIQRDFAAQVKELQEQLNALKVDEMKKMEAVLSKTQLKQVSLMREKAKERLAARRSVAQPAKSKSSKTTSGPANQKD